MPGPETTYEANRSERDPLLLSLNQLPSPQTPTEFYKKLINVIQTTKNPIGFPITLPSSLPLNSSTIDMSQISFDQAKDTSWWVILFTLIILFGRALSCSYRYVTTDDAQKILLAQSDIHVDYVNDLCTAFAILFFLTDTFVTIISAKGDVRKLCEFHKTFKKELALLEDSETQELPKKWLAFLALLVVGGMPGAFLKGKVGITIVIDRISALFSYRSPEELNLAMGWYVGLSSTTCYLAFQGLKGMHYLRIALALQRSGLLSEYWQKEKWSIMGNIAATVFGSVSASLINVTAAFYDKGNFEVDVNTAILACMIAFSNSFLNIFFTTGLKYLITDIEIKAHHVKPLPKYPCSANFIKLIGLISSLGTCLAVYPALSHLLMNLFHEKDVNTENPIPVVMGIIFTWFLALFSFGRDYNYFTGTTLEILYPEAKKSNQDTSDGAAASNQNTGGWKKTITDCLGGIGSFFWKKQPSSPADPSNTPVPAAIQPC